MDGVHDLGGIDGFGPVEASRAEPYFHEDWERRALRTNFAILIGLGVSGGAFRHSIERMDPAHYLSSSYYEHWFTGTSTLLVESGAVTSDQLDALAGGRFPLSRPDRGTAPDVDPPLQPRFSVGDFVRVREWHPRGHTRAPRYVQGKQGTVIRYDGKFNLPDVEAHSDSRIADHTYSVRFSLRELWGPQCSERDVVHVDVWENYLEVPA